MDKTQSFNKDAIRYALNNSQELRQNLARVTDNLCTTISRAVSKRGGRENVLKGPDKDLCKIQTEAGHLYNEFTSGGALSDQTIDRLLFLGNNEQRCKELIKERKKIIIR